MVVSGRDVSPTWSTLFQGLSSQLLVLLRGGHQAALSQLWGLLQEPKAGGNGSSVSDFLCELLTPGNIGRVGFAAVVVVVAFTVCLFFVFLAYTYSDMALTPYPGSWGQE